MNVQVVHNPSKHRFEVDLEGAKALLEYDNRDGQIDLTHTEVPAAYQNRGVGEQLVRAALNFAQDKGLLVVATCPFAKRFLTQNAG